MRDNASYKSFLPIEVAMAPEEYKRRRRRAEDGAVTDDPPDAGNRAVNFRDLAPSPGETAPAPPSPKSSPGASQTMPSVTLTCELTRTGG